MEIALLLAHVDALRLRLHQLLAQLVQLAAKALGLLLGLLALRALVLDGEQRGQHGEELFALLDPARDPLAHLRLFHVGPRCPGGVAPAPI